MNAFRLTLALLLTCPAFAAADSNVLLIGGTAGAGGPATTAIVDDTRITADAIRYEPSQHALRCIGNVTIHGAGGVTSVPEHTVALSGRPTVYVLNSRGITLERGPAEGTAPRAARAAFKGVELYSWREVEDPTAPWWFSLQPGTNALKSEAQVRAPAARIRGVDELKQRLARLAPGEQVFWVYQAPGGGYPPESVVDAVVAAAGDARVQLAIVPPQARKGAPAEANWLKLVPSR